MFDPIGTRLKEMAEKLMWIFAVASAILGCVISVSGAAVIGVAVIVGGIFCAWLGAHLLYGFGQLIENTDKLAGRTYEQPDTSEASSDEEACEE